MTFGSMALTELAVVSSSVLAASSRSCLDRIYHPLHLLGPRYSATSAYLLWTQSSCSQGLWETRNLPRLRSTCWKGNQILLETVTSHVPVMTESEFYPPDRTNVSGDDVVGHASSVLLVVFATSMIFWILSAGCHVVVQLGSPLLQYAGGGI